ncbi:hypothetical protein CXB51_034481 [Gossypium anomalum]|uniref:Integrase catalytic domain-containing protein n=1 Tax=Gossypium anomalum TaxID=47600 RepID=A0A8J5Y5J8_9ROSI|nr:hypothetical protein CXB51_034481 [Gossypium anomalum]
MATDDSPPSDTPRHSSNIEGVFPFQGQSNVSLSNVQYFSKHDTVKLSERNYLPLFSTVTDDVLVHLTMAKTSFKIWTAIERRFGAKSTVKISSMLHALYSIKKANLSVKDYLAKVKSLSDSLVTTRSPVLEQEQVSIVLAGLSMEYESIRILASATPMSLDLLTELLLDCETRQLDSLTEEYKPSYRGHGRSWSQTRGRTNGRGWSRSRPQCQLCGKIKHLIQTCYHRFDEDYSGINSSQTVSVNYHQIGDQCASYCSHGCCSCYQPPPSCSHQPSRTSFADNTNQVWYPDSGATNHVTPNVTALTNVVSYTGMKHVSMGNGVSVPISNVGNTSMLAGSRLLCLQTVLHVPTVCKSLMSVGQIVHPHSQSQRICAQQLSLLELWHQRLRYPCSSVLRVALQDCNIQFHKNSITSVCSACQLGKAHKLPFSSSRTVYSSSFELVTTNVWGPSHVKSNGFLYYVSFVDFNQMVRVQFGYSIKALQSDGGGEYRSLSKELARLGIQHRVTCPHTSEQNGVAERKQQLPTPVLHNQSPYEMLYQVRPSYSYLRVFGCACYPCLRPYHRHNLEFQSSQYVFLGVVSNQKKDSSFGSSFQSVQSFQHQSRLPVVLGNTSPPTVFPHEEGITLRLPLGNTHPIQTRSKSGIYKPKVFTSVLEDEELTSITSAFVHPAWSATVHAEYKALLANHTWDVVLLPPGRRAVGCKWIFKIKCNADGSVARYKGRLVVKWYLQEVGVDFQETFSPVVKPTTIRVVLALAVSMGWSLRQVDINNAFLNGDLQKEIYMEQLPGFEKQRDNSQLLVCRLRKALYGLKQAPRAWFHKLKEFLLLLYVLIYVNDIIVTGNNSQTIDGFVRRLDAQFSLKDLGQLNYFLGIEVQYTSTGVFLNQRKYVLDLLQRAGMDKSNSLPTPMVPTCQLSAHEGNPVDDAHLYRSIVGALQYVVITRPDIAFAVNKVCQFMYRPLDMHFKAIKRILRYLRRTLDHSLRFTKSSKLLLKGFSDASWAADVDDRRSTSGYCVFLGRNPVSWSSRKQQVVSRLTAKAEYRSLAHVIAEMVLIQSLLTELCVSHHGKALVWCDSSAEWP